MLGRAQRIADGLSGGRQIGQHGLDGIGQGHVVVFGLFRHLLLDLGEHSKDFSQTDDFLLGVLIDVHERSTIQQFRQVKETLGHGVHLGADLEALALGATHERVFLRRAVLVLDRELAELADPDAQGILIVLAQAVEERVDRAIVTRLGEVEQGEAGRVVQPNSDLGVERQAVANHLVDGLGRVGGIGIDSDGDGVRLNLGNLGHSILP